MKAVYDAGVREIAKEEDDKNGFIFPSYVEDIMGPELFDYGYGPFRWVCLSGKHEDLIKTDHAAMECIDPNRRGQDLDNYNWIRDAEKNNLVVGTQARILYQDAAGRMKIALKFNEMVRNGEVGPIMLGRDHHDVSGTDSPFRETSNIKDGSNVMADMAVQCFAGNCARGMSLVALHNGCLLYTSILSYSFAQTIRKGQFITCDVGFESVIMDVIRINVGKRAEHQVVSSDDTICL